MTPAILDLRSVTRSFGGLRPLRIERLTIAAGQQVALVGLDQAMAEVFVNLVTGAALPDGGEIDVFGRNTAGIHDSGEWLALVDRFGIVSGRAVLLEGLSVVQNLAMPFSLEIEPLEAGLRARAAALAREVGLRDESFDAMVGALDPVSQLQVRLGRALALEPAIVVLEHPTARLGGQDVAAVGRSIRAVLATRGVAAVTITADEAFARAASAEVFAVDLASGRLEARTRRRWWRS